MLDMLVGAAVAVLSGMGVGSGGLLAVYLTLVTDVDQPAAQALNLFFFLFAAAASTAVNVRRRNIAWGCVWLMGAGGVMGAVAGTLVAVAVEPRLLKIAFGVMLTFIGARGLWGSIAPHIKRYKKERGS